MSKTVAVLLIAWGCAPAVASAGDHPVGFPTDVFAGDYMPASVEATVGDTVTFTGAFANHPLVWSTGDFTTQSTGTTRSYTFTHPGQFSFHCQIHASMVGSVHVAGNQFATPEFSWAPAAPKTGQAVTFTPGAFTDPDGSIARYEWDLDGDGFFETIGAAPSKTYSAAGTFNVGLRYVDDGHEASPATAHAVAVAQGPPTPPPTGGGGGGGGGSTTPSPAPGTPGGSSPTGGGTGATTTAPGGGDQGAGPGSGDTTAPRVRLGARALTFRAGRASAGVTVGAGGSVVARATLKRGKTVLASGSATLRAGARTVRLTLSKAGKAALRRARGRKLSATLTVVAHRVGSKRTVTVKRTLVVKLAA